MLSEILLQTIKLHGDQTANAVADAAVEMIYFATDQLKQFQPQNDYKKFS